MHQALAEQLDNAARKAQPIAQLSQTHTFSEKEAYAIQAASIDRRLARGEQFIGVKLGFTSKAKMEQMGVHDMIWGRLTDAMLLPNGGTLILDQYIHPRAEPELCFRLSRLIDREITLEEGLDFVDGVAAAIEIIDSRYLDFKFSLEDVIADNCSSAALMVGDWQPVDQAIGKLEMALEIDGAVVASGSSEAILGNPWESVVAAARLATQYGIVLPAGSLIMAGAATSAVYLERGQRVAVRVESLGWVAFEAR